MFLCGKKILYLSLLQGEKSESGAGFVRFIEKDQACQMDIQVKKSFCRGEHACPLYFYLRGEEVFIRELSVQAGGIIYNKSFKVWDGKIDIQGKAYDANDFEGIKIRVGLDCFIAGYLKEPKKRRNPETVPEIKENMHKNIAKDRKEEKESQWKEGEKSIFATDLDRELREVRVFESKWDQLMNDYPQIHPFGDERVFISIEPKDFIILQAPYQKLVNNSFLLHGFYNYRYLILGPDKEMGDSNGECFYLGVPGTYFEREKMVAVMFGFEGYECAGSVEIGKFGFYMRKVEL